MSIKSCRFIIISIYILLEDHIINHRLPFEARLGYLLKCGSGNAEVHLVEAMGPNAIRNDAGKRETRRQRFDGEFPYGSIVE